MVSLIITLLIIGFAGSSTTSTTPNTPQTESKSQTTTAVLSSEPPTTPDTPSRTPDQTKAEDLNYKNGEKAVITRVIDGDTVHTSKYKIRIIGLDTPESSHPNKPVQCYSKEAAAQLSSLVQGKAVYLVTDPTQNSTDKYGRKLFHLYLEDGTNPAYSMIRQGYGHEYTYDSNPHAWQAVYREAQRLAREEQKGLWSVSTCNGLTDTTTPKSNAATPTTPVIAPVPAPTPRTPSTSAPTPTPTPTPPPDPASSCNIKGNISRSGEKIYHIPGMRDYDKTIINESAGERIFCSETEAANAGWRRAMR